MKKFKRYYKQLNHVEKVKFCEKCDLSMNYVAKVMAGRPEDNYQFGPLTCIRIEKLTDGFISRQSLRKDWKKHWPELAKSANA